MRADEVIRGHKAFRVLLRAMSRPGTIHPFPYSMDGEDGLGYVAGVLRCVVDNEVFLCVLGGLDASEEKELVLRTGGRTASLEEADFVVALSGSTLGLFEWIGRGTLECPEKGATVVYRVDRLLPDGGGAALTGPGIDGELRPRIEGLADGELDFLKEANGAFPLGVDAIFVDRSGRVMGVPRSTRIERG